MTKKELLVSIQRVNDILYDIKDDLKTIDENIINLQSIIDEIPDEENEIVEKE